MRAAGSITVALAAAAMWLTLGALNVRLADLNQDEGWYLYSARQVATGSLPYRDFAFTQGPVMPIVYAMVNPIVAARGLEAGRWCTFLLSAVALAGAVALAARCGPKGGALAAGVLALVLVGVNAYHSQFTTTVKTYALCAAFLTWGLYASIVACDRRRPGVAMIAGALLALAAGTRLSAGAALPVVCLYALVHPRCWPSRAWLYIGIGGAIALAFLFGPFLVLAPEGLRFGMLEYHAGREVGGLGPALVYKAGFLSRFAGSYFVAACLAVMLLLLYVVRPRTPEGGGAPESGHPVALLWWAALAVSAVHLAAPFPYDDYQVMVYPVFAAAIATGLVRAIARYSPAEAEGRRPRANPWMTWAAWGVLFVCTGAAFSSPVNQAWMVRERDRIWWRLKDQPDLRVLQQAGQAIREQTQEGDLLLTQDTYLAVESDRDVPEGMSMGPFCYFPDMPTDRAERLHVLNRDLLRELLQSAPAPLAAVSGYGLSIASPDVSELDEAEQADLRGLLEQRYRLLRTVPHFGQGHTILRLYERIPEAPAS